MVSQVRRQREVAPSWTPGGRRETGSILITPTPRRHNHQARLGHPAHLRVCPEIIKDDGSKAGVNEAGISASPSPGRPSCAPSGDSTRGSRRSTGSASRTSTSPVDPPAAMKGLLLDHGPGGRRHQGLRSPHRRGGGRICPVSHHNVAEAAIVVRSLTPSRERPSTPS